MMSTMKKTSVKSTEQPVDILQDLPSTSKWTKSVTHYRKRDWSKEYRHWEQNVGENSNSQSQETKLQLIHYPIDNCSTCSDLLKVDNLPETSPVSHYELLRFKTYKETHCLIYPSIAFSNFVQTMETLFCSIFGGVMHQNYLLKTLCKTLEKDITELHKCGITQCLHKLNQ